MRKAARSTGLYLQDILDAITCVQNYAAQGERQFFESGMLQDAIIRQLSIVGEASAKLPKQLRSTQPQIPWADIISMRNIIIHDYSATDLPTVWDTVQTDLPVLATAVRSMQRHLSKHAA